MLTKKVPRSDDISSPRIRIPVDAGQSICKLSLTACKEYRFYGLEGIQTHPRRASAGKKAKNHFFEKAGIAAMPPNRRKFGEPGAYIHSPLVMRFYYILDCYRRPVAFHGECMERRA